MFYLPDVDVGVVYRGNGHYSLVMDKDTPSIEAGSWLSRGEKGELVVRGFVGEKQFMANITLVEGTLHIFTKVSTRVC